MSGLGTSCEARPCRDLVAKDGADTCVVIAAGGKGTRLGGKQYKQFISICGLPMMSWALIAFDHAPSVGHIVIVCADDRVDEIAQTVVAPVSLSTPVSFATSGSTRQESCLSGLNAAPAQYRFVAFHDAARPLITVEAIEKVIAAVRTDEDIDGAIAATPAIDTIKLVEDEVIVATPDRSAYWTVQTPQVFRREAIAAAHEQALLTGFVGTDDASLVEMNGGCVRCVDTQRDNLKVTVPEDLIIAEAILEHRLVIAGYGPCDDEEEA